MRVRHVAAAMAAAALLAACGTSGGHTGVAAIEPRDGRSGLHLTGTIKGRQIVVNDGAPVMRLGDCDVNDGVDTDLCFFSRTVDGGYFAVIIENPSVLEEGVVRVVEAPCSSPHCDSIDDGAVVELQFEPGAPRMRATGGNLTLTTVQRGVRYAGTVSLTLPDGRIGGSLDVIPRPDEDR